MGGTDYGHRRYEINVERLLAYTTVLDELRATRDRIDRTIAALEQLRPTPVRGAWR